MNMLSKAGFNNVHLEEDKGTVYVFDDEGIAASCMSDSAWYGVSFKDQSLEQWVLDVAVKYLEQVDDEELKESADINPNKEYLYKLCDVVKDSDYYKKQLDKYAF